MRIYENLPCGFEERSVTEQEVRNLQGEIARHRAEQQSLSGNDLLLLDAILSYFAKQMKPSRLGPGAGAVNYGPGV